MKAESSRQRAVGRGQTARFYCLLLTAFCFLSSAIAEEISTEEKKVKTQGGIRFNLPEDWPIEKKGAALGPISVEEYVSRKLDAMEKRVAALEGKISSLEKQFQKTEEKSEKPDQLRSKEGPAP